MGINKIINNVGSFIKEKKEEASKLDAIITNSSAFTLDKDVSINEDNLVTCNMYEYNDMCPYINLEYSKLIDGITPVNETVISIGNIREKNNRNEYIMVFTDKRIIIMNKEKYTDYTYDKVINFSLVKKGLMTQVICFNNVILDIDVTYEDLRIIYSLVTNPDYRKSLLAKRNEYLCGIEPKYQKIDKFKSGISIGTHDEIVFHNKKNENYLCKYSDILNYELMEDNTVVMRKWTREKTQSLGFSKKECYKMSIRVTTTNNKAFDIIIMEPTTFNNSYYHNDKTYMAYFDFAKEIIEKLDEYNEEKRNFG